MFISFSFGIDEKEVLVLNWGRYLICVEVWFSTFHIIIVFVYISTLTWLRSNTVQLHLQIQVVRCKTGHTIYAFSTILRRIQNYLS